MLPWHHRGRVLLWMTVCVVRKQLLCLTNCFRPHGQAVQSGKLSASAVVSTLAQRASTTVQSHTTTSLLRSAAELSAISRSATGLRTNDILSPAPVEHVRHTATGLLRRLYPDGTGFT